MWVRMGSASTVLGNDIYGIDGHLRGLAGAVFGSRVLALGHWYVWRYGLEVLVDCDSG